MKKLTSIISILLFIVSCSEEEIKLELFSPETYAYHLDSGWELNAMVQVKGLEFKVDNENYIYSVTYSADILSGDDTLKNIQSESFEEIAIEKLSDIGVEFQVELDSTYTLGKYELIFNIKDDFSGRTASLRSYFELTED